MTMQTPDDLKLPALEKVLGDAMDQWLRGQIPYACTEPHWCARAVVAHMTSDAVIERVAAAAYATDHGEDTFDSLRPGLRQHWRNVARAAVAAAVERGEGCLR